MQTADSSPEPSSEPENAFGEATPADQQVSEGFASEDGTTLSEDPVLTNEPALPNDQAPLVSVPGNSAGASAVGATPPGPASTSGTSERNWLGYAAFVTGALALSVVAIVLGHLGLQAVKRGRASNRDFALAGTILGYIGLVATAVGLWLLLADHTSPADVDVQAQQDVSALGAAAATAAIDTGILPDVAQTDAGYEVAGQAIESHLDVARTLTLTGDGPAGWCLEVAYEGGEQNAFSYTATGGMAQGRCAS